jgi:hypothetical protein
LFHEQDDGTYLATPFNFFVFPPDPDENGPTIQVRFCRNFSHLNFCFPTYSQAVVQMDVKTGHFLAQNGMDFSKWF